MPAVLFEVRDKIAYITLNRPEAMNSLNAETWQGLNDAWVQVRDDQDIWCAIVTGAGTRAFCAGHDLKETAQHRAELAITGLPTGSARILQTPMRGLEVWKPIIAAINGYAVGGGLELALVCDIRIASENAMLGQPEVTRGIIPGQGATQRLPRLVPFGIALELLLTGELMTAQKALEMGLVNKVVPLPELLPTSEAIARRINQNGPLAVRAVKEAAWRGLSLSLYEGLSLEHALWCYIERTEDAEEGPKAFTEKRKPDYKGR